MSEDKNPGCAKFYSACGHGTRDGMKLQIMSIPYVMDVMVADTVGCAVFYVYFDGLGVDELHFAIRELVPCGIWYETIIITPDDVVKITQPSPPVPSPRSWIAKLGRAVLFWRDK